jgi:DNA-binding NarL/FixJ family response regulator
MTILVLSNYDDDRNIIRMKLIGVRDYLVKDFQPDKVLKAIKKALL